MVVSAVFEVVADDVDFVVRATFEIDVDFMVSAIFEVVVVNAFLMFLLLFLRLRLLMLTTLLVLFVRLLLLMLTMLLVCF